MILGIDPGLSGALAFYYPVSGALDVVDMPTHRLVANGKGKTRLDLYRLAQALRDMNFFEPITWAFIEEVHAMPKQGVTSSFSFGFAAGAVQGIVAALGIPMTRVTPNKWKQALGLTGDKDMSRRRASELMPRHAHNWPLKKHDGRAEAALMAYYGYLTTR